MTVPSRHLLDHAQTETVFLTIARAAARVGVSYGTIRNAILAGRLAAFRFGTTYRILSEDLDRFVAACRFAPTRPGSAPPAPPFPATTLRRLDGARLRAAWGRQGVLTPPRGGGRTAHA